MKKFFTLIAATLVAGSAFAQGEGFVNVINNGDLNGTDVTNFVVNDYWEDGSKHATESARILVDKGERCIIVCSNDNPTQVWDAQFFITVPEDQAFGDGTQFQLKMKVKADRNQTISSQSHSAPGSWMNNTAVGDISITTEWATFTSNVVKVGSGWNVAPAGMYTIAFNLADTGTKQANTFYFDDIELWVKRPRYETVENWLNLAVNGDCEGTDGSSLVCREKGAQDSFYQAPGEGVKESAAVVITSVDNASQGWDTQFFITSVHQFAEGEPYKVKFSVRAEANASVSMQTHAYPGGYIGGFSPSSINVTTDWQTFEFMGIAPAPHAQNGPFQSIAFNLNDNKALATKFYFDNIEFCIDEVEASEDEKALAEEIANPVPTAINTAKAAKASKSIYNVAGQQLKSLQKGLNIVDGAKVYVK